MTTEPTSEEIEYMETKYGRETMTKNISKDMVDEKALNAALSLLGGRWSDGRRLIEAYLKAAKTSGMGEWLPASDRSMKMWNMLLDDPIKHSLPLIFKTVIPTIGTHIRLGYYDGIEDAFRESGDRTEQVYRETVKYWYQFPLPPTNDTEGGGRG